MQVLWEAEARKAVGKPLKRFEDLRLITGRSSFLDDLHPPNLLHAVFVRSSYPHARIKKIDLSKVRHDRSVKAVLTGREVASLSKPVPIIWYLPGMRVPLHYALAHSEVNHVGEAVVALAAEDRYSAEDAAELVEVEYELLKPMTDAEEAMRSDAPLVHEDLPDNLCYRYTLKGGEPETVLESSEVVLSEEFRIQRMAASPIEARGVMASYNPSSDMLTVWSSTQFPHMLKTWLANVLGHRESRLRVVAPDVGGAFGVKGEIFPEEIVVPLLSMKTGRPVKWVSTRREDFLSSTHARDIRARVDAGFTKSGVLNALHVKITADFGAYLHVFTAGGPFITAHSIPGPYKCDHVRVDVSAVFTNKVPVSAYRGFGQPEAAFIMERLMDIAADELGLDPAEIRFRNLLQPSDMPYKASTGVRYDSGDYPAVLRKALQTIGYNGRVQHAGGRRLGFGISFYTETTGFAPSRLFHEDGLLMGGYESARVVVTPSGTVEVTVGASPHGQGLATCLAQVCSDILGVNPEDVSVMHGDTATTPYGHGTFGSRSLVVAGNAVARAATTVKEKMLSIASHLLGCDRKDLQIREQQIVCKGCGKKMPFSEAARMAYLAYNLPPGMEPGLESTVYNDPAGLPKSYGAHVCLVELDPSTAEWKILRYVVVHDAGVLVNPLIAEGQIHGGTLQGLAQATLEEIVYDRDGNLLTTSFMDYLLPSAVEAPNIESHHHETPSPLNILGVKGLGEAGTIVGPAAVVNALCNAAGAKFNATPVSHETLLAHLQKRGPHS
ncbi:MAG: xanthine dehydrogenase family protein molybdopterin-binding subunit [Candidatus Caldarchaeum sp.]|nr:xanthine dehydrogenase family protein molybdopterin-binding subunit [Candidatus Caldarchaeum sp.]